MTQLQLPSIDELLGGELESEQELEPVSPPPKFSPQANDDLPSIDELLSNLPPTAPPQAQENILPTRRPQPDEPGAVGPLGPVSVPGGDVGTFEFGIEPFGQRKPSEPLRLPTAEELANDANAFARQFLEVGGSGLQFISLAAKQLAVALPKLGELTGEKDKDIEDFAMFQYGKAVKDFAREAFPDNPELGDSFLKTLSGGAGSMLGFISTGVAGRVAGAGRIASTAIVAGTGAAVEAVPQFEAGKAAGLDDEDALVVARLGAILGLSEAIPIGRIFNRFDKASGGTLSSTMKRIVKEGFKGGAEELIQETFQTVGSNAIAQKILNQEGDLTDGVLESGGAGGILGFLANAISSAAGGRKARRAAKLALRDPVVAQAIADEKTPSRRGAFAKLAEIAPELKGETFTAEERAQVADNIRTAQAAQVEADAAIDELGEAVPPRGTDQPVATPSEAEVKPPVAQVEGVVEEVAAVAEPITLTKDDLPAGSFRSNGLDNIGGSTNARTFTKKFIATIPEFKADPTFTVKGVGNDMRLVHKDGGTFRISPFVLGLDPANLVEGQKVTIDVASFKPTPSRGLTPKAAAAKKARQDVSKAVGELGEHLKDKLFSNPLDPRTVKLAANVVAKTVKAGALTFNEVMEKVTQRLGAEAARILRPAIKQEWERKNPISPADLAPDETVKKELDDKSIQREPDHPVPPKNPVPPESNMPDIAEPSDADADAPGLMDKWIADRDESNFEATHIASTNQDRIKEVVGTTRYSQQAKDLDVAIALYIDLKGHTEDIAKFRDQLTPEQQTLVDHSQNLSKTEQALADDMLEQNRAFGIVAAAKRWGIEGEEKRGVISNYYDNYTARIWDFGDTAKGEQQFAKFKLKTARAKPRVLGSILEGWANGLTLRIKGATGAQLVSRTQVGQVIVDRNMIEMGKKSKLLSTSQPDGWKIVEHPNFKTWKFAGQLEEGSTVLGKDLYLAPDGNQYQRVPLFADPILADKLNNVLGKSALLKIPGARFVTAWNARLKHVLLMSAFFHHQAFIRSSMLGSKTIRTGKAFKDGGEAIRAFGPELRELIRGGLTVGRKQDWDEWILHDKTMVGRAIDKVPGVADVKDRLLAMHDAHVGFLFNVLGPRLKVHAALLEFHDLLRKNQVKLENGETTRHELAKLAADLANDDFGGLNLARLGRNPTAQHMMQLFFLAPDWTESNVRSMAKAFRAGEPGQVYRAFWARIIAKGLGMTILFNLVMAGFGDDDDDKRPLDQRVKGNFWDRLQRAWEEGHLRWLDIDITPIYRALDGDSEKRKYFSLVGHFRDPLKFMLEPARSLKHKSSIANRMLVEALTGTDWAGRRFTTIQELFGFDDRGQYKTNKPGHHVVGDPKGGKLAGQLVARSRGGSGLRTNQYLSFGLHQARQALPIPFGQSLSWMAGEIDGFDAITKSLGMMTSTTFPEPARKALDAAIEGDQDKEARAALKRLFREGAKSASEQDVKAIRRAFLSSQLRSMTNPKSKKERLEAKKHFENRKAKRDTSIKEAKQIIDVSDLTKKEAIAFVTADARRRGESTVRIVLVGGRQRHTAFGKRIIRLEELFSR